MPVSFLLQNCKPVLNTSFGVQNVTKMTVKCVNVRIWSVKWQKHEKGLMVIVLRL